MIRTDEQLAVEIEQMQRIERALESLRAKLMPKNPKNFAIYSEGYVEQIGILKTEIDAYLASKQSKLPETSPTPASEQPSANVS